MGANSPAAITEEKYSSHSQNGNVNKPVAQVENDRPSRQRAPAHTHSGNIARIHGGERIRKSHSPTVLTGFGPSDFSVFSHVKYCLR
jgi:hypothetical protein